MLGLGLLWVGLLRVPALLLLWLLLVRLGLWDGVGRLLLIRRLRCVPALRGVRLLEAHVRHR